MSSFLQAIDPPNISAFFAQVQIDMRTAAFWIAVGKIIWVNILLSGDNALVIAMACRGLHGRHRLWGMVFGSGAAVALRIVFTGIVATLMAIPYLKLAGGLALLLIAAKLVVPEDEGNEVAAGTSLWQAVRIVVIADIIMSLDNVIAIAAAANGQLSLLILGLAICIPMIVAGATVIMMMLDRLPILVWLGALLLGWIAGDVIATDPAVQPWLHHLLDRTISLHLDTKSLTFGVAPYFNIKGELDEYLASVLGALVVLVAGSFWRSRRLRQLE